MRCLRATALLLLWLAATAGADGLTDPLEILIFGASGDVGTALLNEALRRNHPVSAVTRDLSRITGGRRNLTVVQGDLLDAASVRELLPGKDVVFLSVRGAAGGSRDPAQTIHVLGIRELIGAIRALPSDRPRLLIVGGAGSLEVRPGVTYAESVPRFFYLFVSRDLKQEIAGHRIALDFLDGVGDVDWTYVSPPKKLVYARRTGQYRLGDARLPYDEEGRSRISRNDFAVAMLDLAEQGGHVREHLSVVGR
jgi:putative NADH-flavin reductase